MIYSNFSPFKRICGPIHDPRMNVETCMHPYSVLPNLVGVGYTLNKTNGEK